MLDVLFNETVTVWRAGGMDGRGKTAYAQVTDATGGALRLRARLTRRGRRTFQIDVNTQESDAQLQFRADDIPALLDEDIVKTSKGENFTIVSVDRERGIGSGREYGRAQLRKTKLEVPPDPVGN